EVTGVCRLERGIGQTLTCAVGRDEVLEYGETLAEVRGDRSLDDLAGRLGHQSTHTCQLADLLGGTPGTRVGHHVDGVEGGNLHLVSVRTDDGVTRQVVEHLLGD